MRSVLYQVLDKSPHIRSANDTGDSLDHHQVRQIMDQHAFGVVTCFQHFYPKHVHSALLIRLVTVNTMQ